MYDERFHADNKAVEKIFVFLIIDDKKLSKIHRIGRNDPDRTTPRMLIVNMENMLSIELVMKSAFRLKLVFMQFVATMFIQLIKKNFFEHF